MLCNFINKPIFCTIVTSNHFSHNPISANKIAHTHAARYCFFLVANRHNRSGVHVVTSDSVQQPDGKKMKKTKTRTHTHKHKDKKIIRCNLDSM